MVAAATTVPVRNGRFQIELHKEGNGPALVYLHGSGGLQGWPEYLRRLAERFTVYAPLHPGWGQSTGLEQLDDDIRDLAFFYLDFLDAAGIERAHLVGHSLGGMLAAEIAAMDRSYVDRLVLVDAAGLWLDEAPIPDFFVMTPGQLAKALYHDPERIAAQQAATHPASEEAAGEMLLQRYQSLAAAGKFLWPIPDQGTNKRLHRIIAPTLILWGASDRLAPPVYAEAFQ
ncbi:MAG: alpha/beta fold hydrolase, partial [Dehalococcoidia bacterium]